MMGEILTHRLERKHKGFLSLKAKTWMHARKDEIE